MLNKTDKEKKLLELACQLGDIDSQNKQLQGLHPG